MNGVSSVNTNAYKLCFWIFAHLLHDRELMDAIRAETRLAFAGDGDDSVNASPNVSYLIDSCPLLTSVFDELLRYATAVMGQRTAVQRVALGGHNHSKDRDDDNNNNNKNDGPQRNRVGGGRCELRPGTKVLMPYRQMHFNPAVFGAAAHRFDARRFLRRPALARSTSFRPFGGAAAHCPGRFLARREICMYVAIALHRFELALAQPDAAVFPRLDDKKATGGMFMPVEGDDVVVLVKPRGASPL